MTIVTQILCIQTPPNNIPFIALQQRVMKLNSSESWNWREKQISRTVPVTTVKLIFTITSAKYKMLTAGYWHPQKTLCQMNHSILIHLHPPDPSFQWWGKSDVSSPLTKKPSNVTVCVSQFKMFWIRKLRVSILFSDIWCNNIKLVNTN